MNDVNEKVHKEKKRDSTQRASIDAGVKHLSVHIYLCFYKSLIRPHLEFCTAAWSPHYVKDKVLIERIQRRLTKMIPYLKNIPYEERLAKLKLWSLEDRRVRADLIEVFKITHGFISYT